MADFEESIQQLRLSRSKSKVQTILITGCNSGIGLYACKLLASLDPRSRLILVCRTKDRAEYAKKEIQSLGENISIQNIICMECDHSSFRSISKFCSDLRILLSCKGTDIKNGSINGIDVMCLNAAIFLGEDSGLQFTEDEVEITFQTNHLAPFLIANLTHDLINPGGRVVITTSGLHAFSTFGNFKGMIDPTTGEAAKKFNMIAGVEFHHKESYAASKLCNVSFCLELDRRLRKRNIVANCFTPGLIPSSGLFRHQKNWIETVKKKQAVGMDDTEEWGGSILAWMVVSDLAGKNGGKFWRAPYGISKRGGCFPKDLFPAPIFEEATAPQNIEKLWSISAQLTRISSDLISS